MKKRIRKTWEAAGEGCWGSFSCQVKGFFRLFFRGPCPGCGSHSYHCYCIDEREREGEGREMGK